MLADFREFYGLRITDVLKFDGSLPVWEAAILTRQLPQTSRTVCAVQGGAEYLGWDINTHLLAAVVDALQVSNYMFAKVNSKKRVKAPVPVPRPGDAERRKRENLNNPFAQMVQAQLTELSDTPKEA
jgi:hypothetical protein